MAATKATLLCLENPLLGKEIWKGILTARYPSKRELLDKYGLKADDAILAEEKHMGLYEDLLNNYEAKLIAGGAAQNTARGAQYILPPSSVVYIGCVGKDKYADILRDANAKEGLRCEYRVDETTPTGRCGVVITGNHRSLCTDLAAANLYKIDHLKQPEIWQLVQDASIYYVGGYHLTVCVPAILALAEEAEKENKTFMLNLSAPFIPQFFKDPLAEVLPYCDYIICNETEALSYAEHNGVDSKSVPEIAKALAALPKKNSKRERTVIITQGTDPTIVVSGGAVKEYPVRAIAAEKINDTNGAGDAFAGGFVAGIVAGESLEVSVDKGQWLASLSIQELGPAYPYPKQVYATGSA